MFRPVRQGPSFARICLVAGFVLFAGALAFFLTQGVYEVDGLGQKVGGGASRWMKLWGGVQEVRKHEVGDTFGTIFHLELKMFYNQVATPNDTAKLMRTLDKMHETGIKTVMYSVSWEYLAPSENKIRLDYLDNLVGTSCRESKLKVALIVDLLHAPKWVFDLYPDSRAFDSSGRNYTKKLSWFHPLGAKRGLAALRAVAGHMAAKYGGCVVAMQPVYNNEYEAKYTQEYDAYQDYSPYALHEFREWLKAKRPLVDINLRWGMQYKSWSDVHPPALYSGVQMGVDDTARYWDWIRFRESFGAAHFNNACATIKSTGLKCFHHFPEFFSVIDAIYSASMFKEIASSPHTDWLIMDSNFRTPYGTVMNPHKLRLYVGAARAYKKTVYFEAAVEAFQDFKLIGAGFAATMLSGANNLGLTNWHTRIDMNSTYRETLYSPAPKCKATEVVGVFIHLDSCSAWHGVQWHWARRDPLHDFIEDLAERLSKDCGTDLAVYIELGHFLADLKAGVFNRVVFVEPLVLHGNDELAAYVTVKAALPAIKHEILHFPTNSSQALQLKVLQVL